MVKPVVVCPVCKIYLPAAADVAVPIGVIDTPYVALGSAAKATLIDEVMVSITPVRTVMIGRARSAVMLASIVTMSAWMSLTSVWRLDTSVVSCAIASGLRSLKSGMLTVPLIRTVSIKVWKILRQSPDGQKSSGTFGIII